MLQTEMRNVIAQSEKKVVVAIVTCSKQNACLRHQTFVVLPDFRRSRECALRVGSDIKFRGWSIAAERYYLQVLAHDDRAIHQHSQRNWSELNLIARMICYGQRSPKLPS